MVSELKSSSRSNTRVSSVKIPLESVASAKEYSHSLKWAIICELVHSVWSLRWSTGVSRLLIIDWLRKICGQTISINLWRNKRKRYPYNASIVQKVTKTNHSTSVTKLRLKCGLGLFKRLNMSLRQKLADQTDLLTSPPVQRFPNSVLAVKAAKMTKSLTQIEYLSHNQTKM